MTELLRVLMARDNLSKDEAMELIDEMVEALEDGENPEEILHEYAGLEPDYLYDLLSYT